MDRGDRPARIHRHYAFRFALGDCTIGCLHASKERVALALEAVFIATVGAGGNVTPPSARYTRGNVRIHKYGQIGLQPATKQLVQRQHGIASQLAPAPLVGL